MNERARRAGLRDTHYANPIGLDSDRELLDRDATSRSSRCSCAAAPSPGRSWIARGDAAQRRPRARTSRNRNTLVGAVPWMNGVKTGHTQTAGYVPGRRGPARRRRARERRARARRARARATPTRSRCMRWGFTRYRRAHGRQRGSPAGHAAGRGPGRHGRRRPRAAMRSSSRAAASGSAARLRGLPAEVEGPVPRGHARRARSWSAPRSRRGARSARHRDAPSPAPPCGSARRTCAVRSRCSCSSGSPSPQPLA